MASLHLGLPPGVQGLSIWAVTLCLPKCISRVQRDSRAAGTSKGSSAWNIALNGHHSSFVLALLVTKKAGSFLYFCR